MKKPLIFLSHIHTEAEVAMALKSLIEDSFLGAVDIFVSSDQESNGVGEKWLQKVTDNLNACDMEIILCSQESIKKPWINFEAGAGWIREILVAPLCYAGVMPSNLPIPLNLLNAVDLKSIPQLKNLFNTIAKKIGLKEPQVSFEGFIEKVANFEMQYLFIDSFKRHLQNLILITQKSEDEFYIQNQPEKWNERKNIFELLKTGVWVDVLLYEYEFPDVKESLNFLALNGILDSEYHASRQMIQPRLYFRGRNNINQIIEYSKFSPPPFPIN